MQVTRTCTTCGIDYECDKTRKSTRCPSCARDYQQAVQWQMIKKRGSIYEKYIKRLYTWASSEMHRLGLLED